MTEKMRIMSEKPLNAETSIGHLRSDSDGRIQPMNVAWNVLRYGNNGVAEHAILVHIL